MGSAGRDHRRDRLRPHPQLVLDHRARERGSVGGGPRHGRELDGPGELQRAVVHRHRSRDLAPHAREIPAGFSRAGRRDRHQRRLDGHRPSLRRQRDAAGVPQRPDRRLHDEHHPPAGHRRSRVRRRRGAVRAPAAGHETHRGVRVGVFGGTAFARDRLVAARKGVAGAHSSVLVRGSLPPSGNPGSGAPGHPVASRTLASGTHVRGLAPVLAASPRRRVWVHRRAINCCGTTSTSLYCEMWWTGIA